MALTSFVITHWLSVNLRNFLMHEHNWHNLLLLTVLKSNQVVFRQVVFILSGILAAFRTSVCGVALVHRVCLNHAADFAISSFGSLKNDVYFLVLFGNGYLSFYKSDDSWEVFIENRYPALGVITTKPLFLLSSGIVELNIEVEVWLPFVIVDDWNLNSILNFLSSKFD